MGLDAGWEERLAVCILGVRNALETGDARAASLPDRGGGPDSRNGDPAPAPLGRPKQGSTASVATASRQGKGRRDTSGTIETPPNKDCRSHGNNGGRSVYA